MKDWKNKDYHKVHICTKKILFLFLNFPNVLETKCGQLKIELLMSFSWSCVWWFKRREYLNYNLTITSSNPQILVEQWHFNRPHFVSRMFWIFFFSTRSSSLPHNHIRILLGDNPEHMSKYFLRRQHFG